MTVYEGSNKVTSPFGWRWRSHKNDWVAHNGIDIVGQTSKTQRFVAKSGTVISTKKEGERGRTVRIQVHDFGSEINVVYIYQHLAQYLCEADQNLKLGDSVGLEGGSGLKYNNETKQYEDSDTAYGSHCHFEILVNKAAKYPALYARVLNDPGTYSTNDNYYAYDFSPTDLPGVGTKPSGTATSDFASDANRPKMSLTGKITDPGSDEGGTSTPGQSQVPDAVYQAAQQRRTAAQAALEAAQAALNAAHQTRDTAHQNMLVQQQAQQAAEQRVRNTEAPANALQGQIATGLEGLAGATTGLLRETAAALHTDIEAMGRRAQTPLAVAEERMNKAYSPAAGQTRQFEYAAEDLFGLHRENAAPAATYDDRQLAAEEYGALALQAYEYDTNANTYLL